MDAREIESLSMLSRGFQELRDVNPELSYTVILDILSGLNEYVTSNCFFCFFFLSVPLSGMLLFGSTFRPRGDFSHTDESHERVR
jgi:hypothetical protein